MARYDFSFTALGQVLRNRRLLVPIYQRPYSWSAERCADFWGDITSAIAQGDQEYFIGTVVLSNEAQEGRKQIIDGQQRIATLTILLACIRDTFKQHGMETATATIQSDFIASFDLITKTYQPKVVMNSDDNIFFGSLVVEGDKSASPTQQRDSNELIASAHSFFEQKLAELKKAHLSDWYERMAAISSFAEDRLKVVLVSVSTEADAFTIFETLNDRGVDLTVSDLLKNYLFGRSGSEIDVVRDNWIAAVGALEGILGRGLLVDFIRHLWSSRHGATREKDLYAAIKSTIRTQQDAAAFSLEIYQGAQIYAALHSSDHEYWKTRSSIARKNIQTLIRLDLEQIRPLLISILFSFEDHEADSAISSLINWSMRGLIAGGIGGGKTEKAYTDAAQKVRAGSTKTLKDLRSELSSVIRSNAEFEAAFSRYETTNSRFARYLLLALEGAVRKETQPELVANDQVEDVNLEHVLPKRAKSGDWDQFSAGQKRAYVNRLGNLVLLRSDHNANLGNKSWLAKRDTLKACPLILTNQAGNMPHWTPRQIDERQRALARLAVQTWPI